MNRAIIISLILLSFVFHGDYLAEANPVTPIQISIWNPVQLAPENWDVWGLRLNLPYGKNEHVYGLDVGLMNHVRDGGIAVQAGILGNFSEEGRMCGMQISPFFNGSSNLVGIQVSFLNMIVSYGYGIQAGFLNSMGNGNGMQIGLGNIATCNSRIVQFGIINYSEKDLAGSQIGAGALAYGDMTGIQFGSFGCYTRGKMVGLQMGGLCIGNNIADTMTGIQICPAIIPFSVAPDGMNDFVNNYAHDLNGIQIGLWCNRAEKARGLQLGLINIADKMTGVQIGFANIIKESPVVFFPIVNAHF